MIVRNLPYDQLNDEEKYIVEYHWENTKRFCPQECKEDINIFWKNHREQDTENGTYDWNINKSKEEVKNAS